MDAVKMVAANANRRPKDFYPTPKECTYALLDFLHLPVKTRIWEPACGDGAIIAALHSKGYMNCFGTDITTGTDFLQEEYLASAAWIITNPPFSLAEQFIRHAHDLGIPFAFLLKSQYWHSAKRRKLFEEVRPKYVLTLTWRPDFTGQGASIMDVMWCVWTNEKTACTLYHPLDKPKED